jgi:hypothetical protein
MTEDFEPELPDFEADPVFLQADEPAEDEKPYPPQRDLQQLVDIGHLTTDFDLFGHSFCLRTLLPAEEWIAATIIEKWGGTLAEGKAYMAATLAAALVAVDGKALTRPLGDSIAELGAAQLKNFNYISTKWRWPIIERLYGEYSELVMRQAAALEELEGKS